MNLPLHQRQVEMLQGLETETLIGGSAGGGKILAADGVVLTPWGFKKNKDLKVGDIISHISGHTQRIIHLHNWVTLPKYTVTFRDGTSTDVAAEHLWQAWQGGGRRKGRHRSTTGPVFKEVVSTKTLQTWLKQGKTPLIPLCGEVHFNNRKGSKDLMDPYLLGLLLGDGCVTQYNNQITTSHKDRDHYLKKLEGMEMTTITPNNIRFIGKTNKYINKKLKKYRLKGSYSYNKFIPMCYKLASVEVRKALVQGLMDTDGTAKRGVQACIYTTVSHQLAKDITFILRSLGAMVKIAKRPSSYKNKQKQMVKCRDVYTVYIKYKDKAELFTLPRKQHSNTTKAIMNLSKAVVSVEEKGRIHGRCITVSATDGLYITNDFIVTHNSYFLRAIAIILASQIPRLNIYILRRNTGDVIGNHFTSTAGFEEVLADYINQGICSLVYSPYPEVRFANGSKITGRHIQLDKTLNSFQGLEIHLALFDELAHFTEKMYKFIRGRCRISLDSEQEEALKQVNEKLGTHIELPMLISGTNPGGICGAYIKKEFIDPVPPSVFRKMPAKAGGFNRVFLPTGLADNPSLDYDAYSAALQGLGDPALVQALLYGDWNALTAEGAFFNDYLTEDNIIKPFHIPTEWDCKRTLDFGFTSPSVALWIAKSNGEDYVTPDGDSVSTKKGDIFVFFEHTTATEDDFSKGNKVLAADLAIAIKKIDNHFAEYGVIVDPGPADTSIFTDFNGNCPAEDMKDEDVEWLKADKSQGSRVRGWYIMKTLLKDINHAERPGLYIFNNCRHLIKEIKEIQVNPKKPDDLDTNAVDHALDSLRYGLSAELDYVVINSGNFQGYL